MSHTSFFSFQCDRKKYLSQSANHWWLYTCVQVVCSGPMVGTLDSGLGGLDFRPGWVIVLCSWAKHFTLKLLLSTRSRNGYWWIVREVWWNGRGSFAVDCLSIQREAGWGGGKVIVLLVSSFYGNQDKLELDGPLGLGVDFTLPLPKGFRRWRRLENSLAARQN